MRGDAAASPLFNRPAIPQVKRPKFQLDASMSLAQFGQKLFVEFEDVLGRKAPFYGCPLSPQERDELLDAFLGVCEWVKVFYLWRPNLPDEGDNHLVELAVAGNASTIVTQNVRDLRRGELRFPEVRIETPAQFMKR